MGWILQDNISLNKRNKELTKENERLLKEKQQAEAERDEAMLLIAFVNAFMMGRVEINKFIEWARKQDYGTMTDIPNELLREWRNIE